MIHRPPNSDFEQFQNMQESESKGMWIMYILAFFALGAAMSAIITGSRGWSTHSHND